MREVSKYLHTYNLFDAHWTFHIVNWRGQVQVQVSKYWYYVYSI